MKVTRSLSHKDLDRGWIIIDADKCVLGRLSAYVAHLLRGKNKSSYTPHVLCGDNVIIINADKVVLTGSKEKDKLYYRHTGYPGGIKCQTTAEIRCKKPSDLIRKSVKRMLADGPLASDMMRSLKIYTQASHPHAAQQPREIDFLSINVKNGIQ